MNEKVFIIAEAGVNHNGSIELARKLIDTAADAGADAVKFQTFQADRMITKGTAKALYQQQTTKKNESQFMLIKKLELDENAHRVLITHCHAKGIIFLSSPFDLESIDLLCELGLNTLKIPSGEITNLPYLRKIGSVQKKLILSTGMANLAEIEDALLVLIRAGTSPQSITVLHCNTEYPTPMEDVNLRAIQTIKAAFPGIHVGYSDHTAGIEVPLAAVAMEVSVIEKHFTLDKNLSGPDHRASLDPLELKAMVKAIRNLELAMGNGIKQPSTSEKKNIDIVRKSIVAARNIGRNEVFSEENLAVKRPGHGLSPLLWDTVIGKKALRNFQADEMIELASEHNS